MKAVILAGGLGTRISEESHLRPKPMIEVGGFPVLWHIMKIYGHHGITDFVICCGYKGYMIKEYFVNYPRHVSDIVIDMAEDSVEVRSRRSEPWRVTLIDTGTGTQTGGRLKRVADHLDGPFCMTYGDGVGDVAIADLVEFHRGAGREATLTAVRPEGRFGALDIDGDQVVSFVEKPAGDGSWVNGGFMVLETGVLDRIAGDDTVFEREPLEGLAADGALGVWRHHGFWAAMDTVRDRNALEGLWQAGDAPWKVWDE